MASRRHPQPVQTGAHLRLRTERALREGRSQQALELAKALFRQEPTDRNRDLLRRAYLARGKDLHERGADRDAVTVLKAALEAASDDPEWLGPVADQLAQSGGVHEALALLPRLTDPAARDRLLGHVADAALGQGATGRELLPEPYRADFDRVTQAFAFGEAGQDDAAREALAAVGLRSPFLEWKLLVRGLLAYYAGDDARALENWQRLNGERLPARLAAPLRQAIDPPFRTAQPAPTQALLQQQYDRLQGSPLAAQLRGLRAALADNENLAPAFRQAEALLPTLRRDAPALAERLARVFYWAVTETGPEDVPRYQRVFGRPAHDPQFNRLQALAYDRGGDLAGAHKHWQRYEQDIAGGPSRWPDGQAARARALVWLHMGETAAKIPGPDKLARLPGFLRDVPGALRPLKPSAEQCFRRAAELAPELREPYEALVDYHRREGHADKAAAAARRLLERFPDHVPTLEALGDLCGRRDEQAEALTCYERALRGNPLDRRLRTKVASAHLSNARLLAVAGQVEAAREELRSAVALHGGTPDVVSLTRGAAVELKAGDAARAEEFLAQARQRAGSDLVVAYRMLTEVARLKLARPHKTRFEAEFNAGLAEPPTGAAAAGLATTAAALAEAASYVGQKTHVKKVTAYLDRARRAKFTEEQLQNTCSSLLHLDAVRLARQYLERGLAEFPASPHFPYMLAMSYFVRHEMDAVPVWKVRPMLEKAERLARALPPTEQLKEMLDDIGNRIKALAALNPYAMGMMDDIFGGLFGAPFGDEDYEDDED